MIKKVLSIGFAAFISISAFAQSSAVSAIPSQVSAAFQAQYPSVTNVTWDQEGVYYMPSFTQNGEQNTAYIDLKGHLIQTIAKISVVQLPAGAPIYISQNYQGQQISEVGKINFPNGNPSRYVAKVGGKELLFDVKGNFIKVTASVLKQ